MELVQGEGGVHPADVQWVKTLYAYCKEADILFMVDEIQTGIGRTGSLFAYEQYEIEPDAITLAKGLGSGFPIGALLAKKTKRQRVFLPERMAVPLAEILWQQQQGWLHWSKLQILIF